MMREQWKDARERLAEAAKRRFDQRRQDREERLKKVEEEGVLRAAGMDAAIRRVAHMTVAEGRVLEARLNVDDLAPINYLPRGQRAARSVCRLLRDGEWHGTGFLVAPGLLLTNNHVIESAEEAGRFIAEFGHELDLDDRPYAPVAAFSLDAARIFVTSPYQDGLDFTFVAVSRLSRDGRARIEEFGWLPMDERRNKILEGEPCVIIQHPLGEPKQICLFGSELVDRPGDYIHYMTDTDHGASGSPVHNRHWQLIGLHHASTRSDKRRRGRDLAVNEGIRVSSIIYALRDGTHEVTARAAAAAVLALLSDPTTLGDGRPMPGRAVDAGNGATPASTSTAAPEARRTVIGRRSADHFDNRPSAHHGYKHAFLGRGAHVPLPALTGVLPGDAARLEGTQSYELKYTHFSVIHSVSRRMPIVTAVNINGARSQRLGRKDRDFESAPRLPSLELEAAADKWYFDPRIAEGAQLSAPIYDDTDFAFGHVTRREDPVWGDENTARRANDDTFYMTNCATQHKDFNSGIWLALENAVLNAARNNRVKVSVFSGPVFLPDDPEVMGALVPAAFWKIVAWKQEGALRARGYLQSQRELVERIVRRERRRPESFEELGRMEPYEASVASIARITSVDFGPLIEADELRGLESRPRRRLTDEAISSLARSLASATPAEDEPDDGPSATASDVDEIAALVKDMLRQNANLVRLVERLGSAGCK